MKNWLRKYNYDIEAKNEKILHSSLFILHLNKCPLLIQVSVFGHLYFYLYL